MKLLYVIGVLAAIGCSGIQKKEGNSMIGVYNMLSQTIQNDSTDTTYASLRQLKFFTDDNMMMYAHVNAPDSFGSFGIGTYAVSGDTVSEHVFYRAADSVVEAAPSRYNLMISKTDKGFSQIIPEIISGNQRFKLTEEYETITEDKKTPVDGSWKMVDSYLVKGKDTTNNFRTQYKTFFGGHTIWGFTFRDPLDKTHSAVGYGKFVMDGNKKMKETMTECTYSNMRGKTFDIDIDMQGKDKFTQTITEADGTKSVETYERVKGE